MKKSAQVPATLIVTIAATMSVSGCGTSTTRCEDARGYVLPDSACSGAPTYGAHWVYSGGFGGSGGGYGGGSFGG